MTKWMLRQTTTNIEQLSRQSGVSPVLARILGVRGFRSAQEIISFIGENTLDLADPFTFADMDKAVAVTIEALKNHQKIAIFGDYDVDGITSTVILYRMLVNLSADIEYYVPDREEEGYGLNTDSLTMLKESGVDLVIACDNGISSFREVEHARNIDLGIIILDHHDVFQEQIDGINRDLLPDALAVVDAKRKDCPYPFKHYCAAAVCYRFSEALYTAMQLNWQGLKECLLPLVAIATICDLVDLHGENRQLVKHGLPLIQSSPLAGIQALLKATCLKDKQLDTFHIGFILGPCINAAGRLDTADIAIELLLTDDEVTADNIAQELVALNTQRRQLTEKGAKLAYDLIEREQLAKDKIIVLYSPDFRESVSGIIAGRIKEKFQCPTIVIAGNKDIVHGSCRSIEAYNIFEGLCGCQDLLTEFGGHPLAAGLSIEKSRIDAFRQKINALCELKPDDMQAIFRIDCPLPPAKTSLQLAKELTLLSPYGKNNSVPLFAAKNLSVEKIVLLGKNQQVMRILLRDEQGAITETISFSHKEQLQAYIISEFGDNLWTQLLAGQGRGIVQIDIIYSLHINDFNGRSSAQLQIIDFRPAT